MSLRSQIERGLALQEGAKDKANAAVALTAKAKSENTPEAHTAASLAHKEVADGIADWLTSRGRGYSQKMGWHSSWSDYHREKARSLKTGKKLNQELWASYDKPATKSRFNPPRDKYDGNFYDSVDSGPARLPESVATTIYYEFYGNKTGINNRIPICPDCSLPVNETYGTRHPMASGLSALQCQCKRRAA